MYRGRPGRHAAGAICDSLRLDGADTEAQVGIDGDEIHDGAVDLDGAPVPVRHPDLRRLLAYWYGKRDGREFPRRADLDPLDFWFMLERVALTEIHNGSGQGEDGKIQDGDKRRYRLRLVGSWWTQLHGFEPTGLWLEDWPNPGQLQLTTAAYGVVIGRRRPVLASRDAWVDEQKLRYEIMLLPLSEDGTRISMIMTGIGPSRS